MNRHGNMMQKKIPGFDHSQGYINAMTLSIAEPQFFLIFEKAIMAF